MSPTLRKRLATASLSSSLPRLPVSLAKEAQDLPAIQKEIKALVQALNAVHWKTDYKEFCQILGFPQTAYSLEKYAQFENLCKILNNFDITALARIIEAGVRVDRK